MSGIRSELSQRIVDELMIEKSKLPIVILNATYIEITKVLSKFNMGIVFVTDSNGLLLGVVTDGDVRRAFGSHGPLPMFSIELSKFMTKAPRYCRRGESLIESLKVMQKNNVNITSLPILDDDGKLHGAVFLNDIVSKVLLKAR